jgi:hypothetical protein
MWVWGTQWARVVGERVARMQRGRQTEGVRDRGSPQAVGVRSMP